MHVYIKGLDELLNDLVQQLPGLLGIVCADRDGVVLSKGIYIYIYISTNSLIILY